MLFAQHMHGQLGSGTAPLHKGRHCEFREAIHGASPSGGSLRRIRLRPKTGFGGQESSSQIRLNAIPAVTLDDAISYRREIPDFAIPFRQFSGLKRKSIDLAPVAFRLETARKRLFVTSDLGYDPSIRRHRTTARAQRQSGSIPWDFSVDGDGILPSTLSTQRPLRCIVPDMRATRQLALRGVSQFARSRPESRRRRPFQGASPPSFEEGETGSRGP